MGRTVMLIASLPLLSGCLVNSALYEERLAELDGQDNDPGADTDRERETGTHEPDTDGDGYGVSVDCDDGEAAIHPGAEETCNGADDDCDGNVDEGLDEGTWYLDGDGDGWGDPSVSFTGCAAPSGYVGVEMDCDDADADVHPSAVDAIDGVDGDCDGAVDVEGIRRLGSAWIGTEAYARSGSVLAAGDLDGDGEADLVIGSPGDETWPGSVPRVQVVFGSTLDGGSLADADVTVAADEGTQFGIGLAVVDAAGGDRLLVGAMEADWAGTGVGAVLVLDPSTEPSVAPDDGIVLGTSRGGGGFGAVVRAAGDWDGDGIADVAISHVGTRVGETADAGVVFVLPLPEEAVTVDDCASATFLGEGDKAHLGGALHGGLDLNGDGYDDLVAGAAGRRNDEGSTGEAYLFHGGSAGGTVSESAAVFVTVPADERMGADVALLDDTDDDGRIEVAIGLFATSDAIGGRVVVFQGDLSGTYQSIDAEFMASSDLAAAHAGDYLGLSARSSIFPVGNPKELSGMGGGAHLVGIGATNALLSAESRFVFGDEGGDEAGYATLVADDVLFVGSPGADDGGTDAGGVWMVPVEEPGSR